MKMLIIYSKYRFRTGIIVSPYGDTLMKYGRRAGEKFCRTRTETNRRRENSCNDFTSDRSRCFLFLSMLKMMNDDVFLKSETAGERQM